MALDRFIRCEAYPTIAEVHTTCESCLHGGGVVKVDNLYVFLILPGQHERNTEHTCRFVEIFVGSDQLDVMTRFADDFTMAVAEGIADRLARQFKGQRRT